MNVRTISIVIVTLLLAAALGAQTKPTRPQWEYGQLELTGSGGRWQTDKGFEEMKDTADRQAFISRLTGKPSAGNRMAVVSALGSQGWELVSASLGGSDVFILKRRAD